MVEQVVVGVDGSCLRNPGGPTGWAYVAGDGRYHSGWDPVGTNNIGELRAVRLALLDFPAADLTIQIDSAYAMNSVTVWAKGWRRNGWRKRDGKAPENLDLIREIVDLLESRTVPAKFVKVRGHLRSNDAPLNTAADRLAVAASTRARDEASAGEEQGRVEVGSFRPRP